MSRRQTQLRSLQHRLGSSCDMPAAPGVSPAYPLGDKPAFAEQLADADALDPIPNAIVLNWATIIVLAKSFESLNLKFI